MAVYNGLDEYIGTDHGTYVCGEEERRREERRISAKMSSPSR